MKRERSPGEDDLAQLMKLNLAQKTQSKHPHPKKKRNEKRETRQDQTSVGATSRR